MGEISKQLHVKMKAMASNVLLPRSSKGRKPSTQTPDIARLIEEGIEPVHAAYIFVHHIASVFAENVSQLLEMGTFTKKGFGKAEDDYLPDGPPMSPLTGELLHLMGILRPPNRENHGYARQLPDRRQ